MARLTNPPATLEQRAAELIAAGQRDGYHVEREAASPANWTPANTRHANCSTG